MDIKQKLSQFQAFHLARNTKMICLQLGNSSVIANSCARMLNFAVKFQIEENAI